MTASLLHAVSRCSSCRCILSDLFVVDLVSKEGVVNRTDRTLIEDVTVMMVVDQVACRRSRAYTVCIWLIRLTRWGVRFIAAHRGIWLLSSLSVWSGERGCSRRWSIDCRWCFVVFDVRSQRGGGGRRSRRREQKAQRINLNLNSFSIWHHFCPMTADFLVNESLQTWCLCLIDRTSVVWKMNSRENIQITSWMSH